MSNERLAASAWVEAALSALIDGGPSAVAVESLARTLGVTKGSFYWHFKDRAALLSALVERWASVTEAIIERVGEIPDPRRRLRALLRLAHGAGRDRRAGRAMAALAAQPTLGPRVRAVVARRNAFLAGCFEALGLPSRAAVRAGTLLHAAYLGLDELEELGTGLGNERARVTHLLHLAAALVAEAGGSAREPSKR